MTLEEMKINKLKMDNQKVEVTIKISAQTYRKLLKQSRALNKDCSDYINEIIEKNTKSI